MGWRNLTRKGTVFPLRRNRSIRKSNYAVVGLYFYPNKVVEVAKASAVGSRGTGNYYGEPAVLEDEELKVQTLGRGFAWLDTGTHDSLAEVSTH